MRKTKEGAMDTRRRLLDSALDIMSEKPFQSVSMSEIAERIGLSKGAVYWHFKNKNDVLISLMDVICGISMENLRRYGQFQDGFQGLRSFFSKKLADASDERARKAQKLIHNMYEWPEDAARRVIDSLRGLLEAESRIISGMISRAQERREIRGDIPPEDIAGIVSAILFGIIFVQMHGFFKTDFLRYTDSIMSALEREFTGADKIAPLQKNIKQCDDIRQR